MAPCSQHLDQQFCGKPTSVLSYEPFSFPPPCLLFFNERESTNHSFCCDYLFSVVLLCLLLSDFPSLCLGIFVQMLYGDIRISLPLPLCVLVISFCFQYFSFLAIFATFLRWLTPCSRSNINGLLPRVRGFWYGFAASVPLPIVMGIFVLLGFQSS